MTAHKVSLPEPRRTGDVSVEEAITTRRSRRTFAEEPVTLRQVSQLAWSAQGITGPRGRKRAAPSAGATYPMELYVAAGEGGVKDLEVGTYRYHPSSHGLIQTGGGDIRARAMSAALGQRFLRRAPLLLLIAADYRRTTQRYSDRGRRYVWMEAGHISENVYLEAQALGLATVAVGAFHDAEMADVFGLPEELDALYVMAAGNAE